MATRTWASWWATLTLAVHNLSLHKLRSFLTILGTLLGVASVISMLAIGEGSKRKAIESIHKLGANNVIIRSVKPEDKSAPPNAAADQQQGGNQQEQQIRTIEYGLEDKDFERLQETIPNVIKAVPVAWTQATAQRGPLRIQNARILGTTPDLIEVRHLSLRRGHFIAWPDVDQVTNVAVLAAGAAQKLFSYIDPINKKILLGTQAFTVIGVLQAQGSGNATPGAVGQDSLNDDIYIPLTTSKQRIGEVRLVGSEYERVELSEITLTLADEQHVKATAAMARKVLKQSHPKENDFKIEVPLELLQQAEHERRIWNLVLGSIAGISLLVGGIGIMNIMLATVTERTREIGLRMAVGATRMDITVQFLVESTTLSAMGGLLGVILGAGIPLIVKYFSDIQTHVSGWSIALAFGISVFIGVVFGVYPARRACNLDPIEALRSN